MEIHKENIFSPPTSHFKKVNEVLYSLEDEYIFEIAVAADNIALSGSTHQIKLYNGVELKHVMSLSGHTASISKLEFDPTHSSILYTSSQDGSVRRWDIRVPNSHVQMWQLPSRHEAMSHACSHFAHLLAVGSKLVIEDAFIHFFDLRSPELRSSFSESMSDDVTQLAFHPLLPHRLLSGSADGIACIFDLVKWDEYEDLTVSMPAGVSINKLGWYGENFDQVWLTTHAETFSLWTSEGDLLNSFGDIRQSSSTPTPMDYIITCLLCPESRNLYLTAGSNMGDVSLFKIQSESLVPIYTCTKGHSDIVRDAALDWQRQILYTGGEDAMLIAWSGEELAEPLFEAQTRRKADSNSIFQKIKQTYVPYHR